MLSDLFFSIGNLGLPAETQIIPWVLAVIWSVFALEQAGLVRMPRVDPRGDLTGILTANLGHESLAHIASNSMGVMFLLWWYMKHTPDPWVGLAVMYFGSTGLYWLLGASSNNNGRGMSYALYALNGWFLVWIFNKGQGSLIMMAILAAAGLVIIKHSLPGDHGVAWSAHLSGLVVGVSWAFFSFGYADRWFA